MLYINKSLGGSPTMQNCSMAKLMAFLVSYWTLAGACANHTHIAANRGPSRAPGLAAGALGAAAGNLVLPRGRPSRELEALVLLQII
jgi:hypothetical protein